jgi:hypothetical protein
MRRPRMTHNLRDCVSREVERAWMRDVVVHLSSCQCFVKVREVLSSTPRTRYVSEGPMATHTLTETLGEPIAYIYTNLKPYAHTNSTKHTHTPLSQTSKHGHLLARAKDDGADFTFHKKHTKLTNTQFNHKQEFVWGVHNPRLLTHNPTMRCPMCGQFTNNGHMAGISPTMSGLRQDRHNSALQLPLSLLERHNGGRWETITADFGIKPIK